MSYPSFRSQLQPFSAFSPAGILWNSVGASPAYEIFAGVAELAAGLLLMFPQTVTLGALACLADMTQVWMLNMTYDVPVKAIFVSSALDFGFSAGSRDEPFAGLLCIQSRDQS
jgi:UPF0716 family protein affecting phage T7 exclusion